ncbi:MFS transporter [Mangrovibacter sp. SLW1]
MLWLTYFMGLFVIYLLNGWLPTIMRSGGISLEQAAIIAGLFQLGGPLGGIIVGALMDKFRAKWVIGVVYFIGCLCLISQGLLGMSGVELGIIIFITGMCINGAQNGLQVYSPAYYPTEIRATGVSWMHGIGRIGAILSSTLGGFLMGIFPGQSAIFFILALPALFAAISIVLHRNIHLTMKIKGAGLGEIPALSQTLNNR